MAVAKDWAQRESVEAIVLAVEGMATYIHNFGECVSMCRQGSGGWTGGGGDGTRVPVATVTPVCARPRLTAHNCAGVVESMWTSGVLQPL